MRQHKHRLSPRAAVVFGPTPMHDVIIETTDPDGTVHSVALTADDWGRLVDRGPYLHLLAERWPPPV